MSVRTHVSRHALFVSVLGLALPAAAYAQCPSTDQVGKTIQEVFKRPGIEVKRVKPAAIKGLCEIHLVFQKKGSMLYTDATGAYFIANGVMIDTKSSKNLTEESLASLNEELEALNALSPEEMKKVDGLVAMTLGTKGPAVYFVTDPM